MTTPSKRRLGTALLCNATAQSRQIDCIGDSAMQSAAAFCYPTLDSSTLSCLCPKSCGNEKKRQCGQGRLSFVLVTIPAPSMRHEVSRLGVLLVMMRLRRFTGKNVLTTVTTSQPEYRSPCHFGHPSTADSLLTRGAAECRDSPSPGKAGRRGQ